jgi:hypothetical protein
MATTKGQTSWSPWRATWSDWPSDGQTVRWPGVRCSSAAGAEPWPRSSAAGSGRRSSGEDIPDLHDRSADEDADFSDVDQADPAEALSAFERECASPQQVVGQVPSPDDLSKQASERTGQPWPLRCIFTHMIEEYTRHNGHADLLPERVDRNTGYYRATSPVKLLCPARGAARAAAQLLTVTTDSSDCRRHLPNTRRDGWLHLAAGRAHVPVRVRPRHLINTRSAMQNERI